MPIFLATCQPFLQACQGMPRLVGKCQQTPRTFQSAVCYVCWQKWLPRPCHFCQDICQQLIGRDLTSVKQVSHTDGPSLCANLNVLLFISPSKSYLVLSTISSVFSRFSSHYLINLDCTLDMFIPHIFIHFALDF